MNETFAVTLTRTKDWLYQERLKTGQNVPAKFTVQVNPARLTPEARAVWLNASTNCDKCYENFYTLGYNEDYTRITTCYSGWGNVDLVINAYEPTPQQISDAILAAKLKVDVKRLSLNQELERLKNKLDKLVAANEQPAN